MAQWNEARAEGGQQGQEDGDESDSSPNAGSYFEYLWSTLKNRQVESRSPGSSSSVSSASDDSALVSSLSPLCGPAFDWALNSDGYNPCQLARMHADVCSDSASFYPINQLADGEHHYPSLNRLQASACTCSIPVYNLIQACAACQLPLPSGLTTPYARFTSNCSFAPPTFPYSSPSPLPAWARIDPWSNGGSINITVAFFSVNGGGTFSQIPFSSQHPPIAGQYTGQSTVSPPQTASTPVSPATSSSTPLSASPTPPVMADGHQPGPGGASKPATHMGAIIAAVVVTAIALGVLAGVVTWLRRKRRVRRQGTRLGSTTDLHDPKPDGDSGSAGGGPFMREKRTRERDDYSLFVPTESFLSTSTRSMSRTASFTTNSSSSSQSPSHDDYRAFLVHTTNTTSASDFNSGTSFTGSSSSTTSSSSETETSRRESSRDSLSVNLDADDMMSPFADRHRAPSIGSTSTRITMSDRGSYPSPSPSVSAVPPPLRRPQHAYVTNAGQRLSVATMASLTPSSASSRAAPSSTGAVYGRDDDASSFDSRRE